MGGKIQLHNLGKKLQVDLPIRTGHSTAIRTDGLRSVSWPVFDPLT